MYLNTIKNFYSKKKLTMQITIFEQSKTIYVIRHLLSFIIHIGFSSSTLDLTSICLYKTRDFSKLISEDMSVLNNEIYFHIVKYKLEIEKLNGLIDFNESLAYKLIEKIYVRVKNENYKNMPMEQINIILDIIIRNMSEFSENSIFNEFFNGTILNLIGIYSNYEKNDLNSVNFNEKIIPIANNIINMNKTIFIENKKIFRKYVIKFADFTKKKIFFFNLEKNEKLKKHFYNIINENIIFLKNDNEYFDNAEIIYNFFNKLVLESINNKISYENDFFITIYYISKKFIEYLKNNMQKDYKFEIIKNFLNKLLVNLIFLEKFKDMEILIKLLNLIAKIELGEMKKENNTVYLSIIEIYTEFLVKISEENKEKNSLLIENFEKNINKILKLIKSYQINCKNSFNNIETYIKINKYLYKSRNHFYSDINIIKSIRDTFYGYITKIVIFELEEKKLNLKNTHINYIINDFFSKTPKDLENYNLRKINCVRSIEILKYFNKKIENKGLSINIITIKDKNFSENMFQYDYIDINEAINRNLILNFLGNCKNDIFKFIYDIEDVKFFLVSTFYIINLSKKLDLDENSKNNYLENLNKLLSFKTETQRFIDNEDGKDFRKLSIVKFIYFIKESDLKILDNLEEIDKENYKYFMISFIDSFKNLKNFYNKKKKYNSEFRKTVYADFLEIFTYEIEEIKHCNIKKTFFYWIETTKRNEIFDYFDEKFFIGDYFENEIEPKRKKKKF